MKKFTSTEIQRATEEITAAIGKSKRGLPVGFALEGKKVLPILLKKEELTDEEKRDEFKKVKFKFGNPDSEDKNACYGDVSVRIRKFKFTNAEGDESYSELPMIAGTPDEIIRLAKNFGEIFIALRNSVLTMSATRQEFINNSTVEPATGIILADILVNSGRIQQGVVKDVIEAARGLDGSKQINAALSEYNASKASKNLIEAIGDVTARKFVDGCDTLLKHYETIKNKTSDSNVPAGNSSANAVLKKKQEGKMELVTRNSPAIQKLKSLI